VRGEGKKKKSGEVIRVAFEKTRNESLPQIINVAGQKELFLSSLVTR